NMIQLAYFTSDDFLQLKEWISNDEILMNWSGSLFSFPLTIESLSWYIENVNVIGKSEAFVYKAINTETGKIVGHISLGGISKKNRAGRISRVFVAPEYQGKGYCNQMVTAVLKIGFEELKLHRICLGVYDFNIAAISCYKKAGMVVEGTNRDCLQFKGSWWSLVEMSMLEGEWRGE
ncbi:MAG: GNAT family protein, partial [Ferruginibacter sp.]